jgi:predicted transposase/invertase (TIGR01784 family)
MRTGIDPTVDFAFKRVFSKENEALLVHFLNAVLDPEPSHRIVSIETLSTVNDRHTEDDKLTVVDLRVRDSQGRRIIVEMQLVVTAAFRERSSITDAGTMPTSFRTGTTTRPSCRRS